MLDNQALLLYFRFLHENSDVNYFTIGAKSVGQCCETTAVVVSGTEPALIPLVNMIRVSTLYLNLSRLALQNYKFSLDEYDSSRDN